MAAALGALEDEPARSGGEELPQQAGRGDMQKGGDALGLQRGGLGGPAARDDRVGRLQLPYDIELRGLDLLVGESEHTDAPGRVRECLTGALQHRAGALRAREGQCEKGQRAPGRDGGGEVGLVAHPGHRPLGDGQSGAQDLCARRSRGQRGGWLVVRHGGGHRGPDTTDRLAHGSPALREGGGEEGVLTDRQELGPRIVTADPGRELGWVFGEFGSSGATAAQHPCPVVEDGLGAVEPGERGGDLRGQPRLVEQRELGVQYDTGRAPGDDGGGRVGPDAAARPDGQGDGRVGQYLLHQHEGAQLTRATAAFGAADDQSRGPVGDGAQGARQIGHLHQDTTAA